MQPSAAFCAPLELGSDEDSDEDADKKKEPLLMQGKSYANHEADAALTEARRAAIDNQKLAPREQRAWQRGSSSCMLRSLQSK